jgi:hypothetical protein
MMNPALSVNDAPPSRRGRWLLLALLAIVLGPMVLASAMYQWRFWVPETRTYHGELIGDGSTRGDLGVQADEKRWQLLVTAPRTCAEDCRQLVYLARQIQIGLNRETARASHALAISEPLADDYEATLQREYPQLGRYLLDTQAYRSKAEGDTPALWIVDPLGNLVLRYDVSASGRAILKDLQLLLKLSRIG